MTDVPSTQMLTRCAAISAAIAIAASAFGAHGAADAQSAEWLRTGGMYQLVHAVAVIALAGRAPRISWAMLGGAAIFAATLYAMAVGAPRWLGAITPIGGATMIAAWAALAFSGLRTKHG